MQNREENVNAAQHAGVRPAPVYPPPDHKRHRRNSVHPPLIVAPLYAIPPNTDITSARSTSTTSSTTSSNNKNNNNDGNNNKKNKAPGPQQTIDNLLPSISLADNEGGISDAPLTDPLAHEDIQDTEELIKMLLSDDEWKFIQTSIFLDSFGKVWLVAEQDRLYAALCMFLAHPRTYGRSFGGSLFWLSIRNLMNCSRSPQSVRVKFNEMSGAGWKGKYRASAFALIKKIISSARTKRSASRSVTLMSKYVKKEKEKRALLLAEKKKQAELKQQNAQKFNLLADKLLFDLSGSKAAEREEEEKKIEPQVSSDLFSKQEIDTGVKDLIDDMEDDPNSPFTTENFSVIRKAMSKEEMKMTNEWKRLCGRYGSNNTRVFQKLIAFAESLI